MPAGRRAGRAVPLRALGGRKIVLGSREIAQGGSKIVLVNREIALCNSEIALGGHMKIALDDYKKGFAECVQDL